MRARARWRRVSRWCPGLALLAACACSETPVEPEVDSGPPPVCEFEPEPDAGAAADAGVPDAGDADGGVDAGAGGTDAAATDAGMDAGMEAGMDAAMGDLEAGVDAGTPEPIGLILLYEFDEGSGDTVGDSSGQEPPIDLTIVDPESVTWVSGRLVIDEPTIVRTTLPPTRLAEALTRTNEITVEAWVRPRALEQSGPARIVTYSIDTGARNFTLGQSGSTAVVRLQTTMTDANGIPVTQTGFCTFVPRHSHLVYTRDRRGITRLYIDGEIEGSAAIPGTFEAWDAEFHFALANELTLDRPWLGELLRVTVHDEALAVDDVAARFAAGPESDVR